MKKYICIDESGIHSGVGHSTIAFAYVEYENKNNLDIFITETEKNLGLDFFHWRKHNWKIRKSFAKKISELDFVAKVSIFENPVHPENILSIAIGELLVEKDIYKIFIDGDSDKSYVNTFKKSLRDKNIKLKYIQTQKDEANPGLRLADFIAGAVRSHYDDLSNEKSKEVYDIIKSKLKIVFLQH
jgi:hypothetical protein